MAGRRRNCSRGIVDDVPPSVERHLRLVLWVVGRVVIVTGVVEVIRGPDTVLRVEAWLLSSPGRLAPPLSRGYGGRDDECEDKTDEHNAGDAVE